MKSQNNDEKVFLTANGLEKLQKEHQVLVKDKRPKLVRRLASAREQGDLSENQDYKDAREALNLMDTQIEELESVLEKAVLVKEQSNGSSQVVLGSRVEVEMEGKTLSYELVGDWEADPLVKKISYKSPLGKKLVGKKVGDQVEVEAPAGKLTYKITSIG